MLCWWCRFWRLVMLSCTRMSRCLRMLSMHVSETRNNWKGSSRHESPEYWPKKLWTSVGKAGVWCKHCKLMAWSNLHLTFAFECIWYIWVGDPRSWRDGRHCMRKLEHCLKLSWLLDFSCIGTMLNTRKKLVKDRATIQVSNALHLISWGQCSSMFIPAPSLWPRTRQEKGAAPTELDQEVAKAIFDIEVSPSCDIKAELKDVYISGAKDVEVGKAGMAMVVHFPFRVWKIVKKIQGRLIRELEKKFNRKHVVLVANRTILDKNFRRKGLKVRPRSRTLTAVHESILEDLVGPTEIVGKRTRISVDGSKLMKILLDPKDKDKENIESKLPAFAAVYKKLTNKEAQFMFPTVWNVEAWGYPLAPTWAQDSNGDHFKKTWLVWSPKLPHRCLRRFVTLLDMTWTVCLPVFIQPSTIISGLREYHAISIAIMQSIYLVVEMLLWPHVFRVVNVLFPCVSTLHTTNY